MTEAEEPIVRLQTVLKVRGRNKQDIGLLFDKMPDNLGFKTEHPEGDSYLQKRHPPPFQGR